MGWLCESAIRYDKAYFFIQELECEIFNKHYHSYLILEKNTYDLVEIGNLFHYHPLNKNMNLDNNDKRIFIRSLCIIP